MIRLRNTDGTTEEIAEDTRFVEICDIEGSVGRVVFMDDTGVIREIRADDAEGCQRYSKAFGVPFVPVRKLDNS